MSDLPASPPDSSSSDPQSESLLAPLRQTGMSAPLSSVDKGHCDKGSTGSPPVDGFIPWMRDIFAAIIAMGIALAVLAGIAAVWLWARSGNRVARARQSQRARAERAARQMLASAPGTATDAARPAEIPAAPQSLPVREAHTTLASSAAFTGPPSVSISPPAEIEKEMT